MTVGPRNQTTHPSVTGRPEEFSRFVAAQRSLTMATVTTRADADTLLEVARELDRVADEVDAHLPAVRPPRILFDGDADPRLNTHAPFDPIVGPWSPVSAPLLSYLDPPFSRGEATYGPAFEGPPGLVHGAAIAAAFDMALALANSAAKKSGPTLELCVRYLRPTRLGVPVTYESKQDRVDGRKLYTEGTLVQDGVVTAEASGLFLHFDASAIGERSAATAASLSAEPMASPVRPLPPTTHPELQGRLAELVAVADAIRRVMVATVTHIASAAQTEAWAKTCERLHARLSASIGDPFSRFGGWEGEFDPNALFVFDMVFGRCNPLAPPLHASWSDGNARAAGGLDRRFEGAPDAVHGGVLAAVFDQVCNVANVGAGLPGLTTELCISYRNFTPVDQPLMFSAEIEADDGATVTTIARCHKDDTLTAEARGTFRRI